MKAITFAKKWWWVLPVLAIVVYVIFFISNSRQPSADQLRTVLSQINLPQGFVRDGSEITASDGSGCLDTCTQGEFSATGSSTQGLSTEQVNFAQQKSLDEAGTMLVAQGWQASGTEDYGHIAYFNKDQKYCLQVSAESRTTPPVLTLRYFAEVRGC